MSNDNLPKGVREALDAFKNCITDSPLTQKHERSLSDYCKRMTRKYIELETKLFETKSSADRLAAERDALLRDATVTKASLIDAGVLDGNVPSMFVAEAVADLAADRDKLLAEVHTGYEAGWHALRNERDVLRVRCEHLEQENQALRHDRQEAWADMHSAEAGAKALRALLDEPLRVIVVEAIRNATGCSDLMGRNGEYMSEAVMRLVRNLVAEHDPRKWDGDL